MGAKSPLPRCGRTCLRIIPSKRQGPLHHCLRVAFDDVQDPTLLDYPESQLNLVLGRRMCLHRRTTVGHQQLRSRCVKRKRGVYSSGGWTLLLWKPTFLGSCKRSITRTTEGSPPQGKALALSSVLSSLLCHGPGSAPAGEGRMAGG